MSPEQLQGQSRDSRSDIVIIADGWTRRVFDQLYLSGELPEIKDRFIDSGGSFIDVISNLPSVSLASHTTLLTGASQESHGIVGHRWRDRNSNDIRNYLGPLGMRSVNADIAPDVPTIFEMYARSVSVQSVVNRGASERSFVLSARPHAILRELGRRVLQEPAGVFVAWLPRGDGLAHTYGPDSRQVADDMRAASSALGGLVDTLESSGIIDDARILVVPDHGHRKVTRTIHLARDFASLGVPAVTNQPPKDSATTLILTSGDSAANVYLSDQVIRRRVDIGRKVGRLTGVALACVPERDHILFFSDAGEAVAEYSDSNIRYEVQSGVDPLGKGFEEGATRMSREEPYLVGPYPDLLAQISSSFYERRSGDILVLAGDDTHFGLAPRAGWRLGYHRGTHGGPTLDEVLVRAVQRGFDVPLTEPIRSAELLGKLEIGTGSKENSHARSRHPGF